MLHRFPHYLFDYIIAYFSVLFVCHKSPSVSALRSRLQQVDSDFAEGASDESYSDYSAIEDEVASAVSPVENVPQVEKSSSQQVQLNEQDFKILKINFAGSDSGVRFNKLSCDLIKWKFYYALLISFIVSKAIQSLCICNQLSDFICFQNTSSVFFHL